MSVTKSVTDLRLRRIIMNIDEIEKSINMLEGRIQFIGGINQQKIDYIEDSLGVQLSTSYKWFLSKYGVALLPGFTILGAGLSETPICIRETIDWRQFGLPPQMVVIENEGTDWIYCLDTSRLFNGECPVIDWEQGKGIGKEYFDNFLTFFEARLKESLQIK
jgi:antitoxin YobK